MYSIFFELIELFTRAKKPLGVRDIVEEFSWPRSSVSNMVSTIVGQDIENSVKDGWYSNLALYQPGVAGVAVPFPFCNRRNAIVLGGPVSRIEQRIDLLGKLLRNSVSRYSGE